MGMGEGVRTSGESVCVGGRGRTNYHNCVSMNVLQSTEASDWTVGILQNTVFRFSLSKKKFHRYYRKSLIILQCFGCETFPSQ